MKRILLLLIVSLIYYIFGSFIAWDLNPLNWWLFTSWVGRILFLFFYGYTVVNCLTED